jgi:hypothetical protein
MASVLTNTEIRAALEIGGPLAGRTELADPVAWADLCADPDATAKVVRSRLDTGRTPHRGQVFRWPKEKGGYRPMAWLDPLDQTILRGIVGRLATPIAASVDDSAVLSARLTTRSSKWELEPWGKAIAERRRRGLALLEQHPVMGLMDVKEFFPSVRRKAIEDTIGTLPVHAATFEFVLDWLDELSEVSGIKGLPTGHEASRVLANGLLVPGDDLLSSLGVPFLRYVDDTWFFVDQPSEFFTISDKYREVLAGLGLELHPTKTTWVDDLVAQNEIERLAIGYFEDVLDDPGPQGLSAGLELFEFSLEDPVQRKSELRRALRALQGHRNPRPLDALREDGELLRVATHGWVRYMRAMMANKPTRRLVGDDWLVEQATRKVTKDDSYSNLLYLQALSKVQLDKKLGRTIFDLATNEGGWCAPVRVWAAHVWGHSDAFNPHSAVEQVEERGDYSTRRAFALTLVRKRSDRKLGQWARRVRLADSELEPTAQWLDAA